MPSTSTRTRPQPLTPLAVGSGVTLCYPQDRYGYAVVATSPSGKTAWVVRLFTPDTTTGHKPARFDGPFPVWEHFYTDAELAAAVEEWREAGADKAQATVIRLTTRGWQSGKSSPFVTTHARFLRNYSY